MVFLFSNIGFLLFFSVLVNSTLADNIKPSEVIPYKNIHKSELDLHIFYPSKHKNSDQRSVIIFFHGGGWVKGNPKQFYGQSKYLASRGMVAISAEYRTSSKHNIEPKDCVEDAKSAVRWVRSHAKLLGINPEKIAVGGGSAGGHLAASTAFLKYFDNLDEDLSISSHPNALVLFNPVFDNGPKGFRHKDVKKYWRQFSPIDNIKTNPPPTIMFFGSLDKLIPVETIHRFKRLIELNGGRCDLFLYKNLGHGFFNQYDYNLETIKKTEDFLISIGFFEKNNRKEVMRGL